MAHAHVIAALQAIALHQLRQAPELPDGKAPAQLLRPGDIRRVRFSIGGQQGLGGGGLIALALAIIGDVIPPRERGKYQGMFGAVFGVSSVAGPLLGGFFTDGPGWRWIFWLNIPIGLAALFITSRALHMPVVRREHKVDYLGAALVVGSVSSILLYLSWAGEQYGWTDPVSLTLLAVGLLLAWPLVWTA